MIFWVLLGPLEIVKDLLSFFGILRHRLRSCRIFLDRLLGIFGIFWDRLESFGLFGSLRIIWDRLGFF